MNNNKEKPKNQHICHPIICLNCMEGWRFCLIMGGIFLLCQNWQAALASGGLGLLVKGIEVIGKAKA